jgi:hypothetical protein
METATIAILTRMTSTESDINDGDEVTSKEWLKFLLPMNIIRASLIQKLD